MLYQNEQLSIILICTFLLVWLLAKETLFIALFSKLSKAKGLGLLIAILALVFIVFRFLNSFLKAKYLTIPYAVIMGLYLTMILKFKKVFYVAKED